MPRKDVNDNIYKIRDSVTGLYSSGGSCPHFNKKGKTWSQIGHVKTHLAQFEAIPDTWEIIEIEQRPCSIKQATECFRPPDPKQNAYRRTRLRDDLFPEHQRKAKQTPQQIVNQQAMLIQIMQGIGVALYQMPSPPTPKPTFPPKP